MLRLATSGILVAFEGVDASGSDTTARNTCAVLVALGIEIFPTREPDEDFESGRRIRRVLQGEETIGGEEAKRLLYAENRREHMGVVLAVLGRGVNVVSVRSLVSSLAYGMAHGVSVDEVARINDEFPWPDLVIWLRTPVEETQRRLAERGQRELHDALEAQRRIDAAYEWITGRWQGL